MAATTVTTGIRSGSRRGHDNSPVALAFLGALWLSLALGIVFLMTLIVTTAIDGAERFDSELITEYGSTLSPETTGLRAALLGTLWLMVTTALMAIPVGVAAAVYLEEFADNTRWYNRLVELNLQNLAAVPSVIYGMLAVGIVALFGIQRTGIVLVGAVALGLLILPVIIITTREAVRAVPREIREGSLALGATPLQTTWRQVLPSAIPGIATGTIIALSRAIGEAAPLLIVGVAVTVRFDPDGLMSSFTAMPIQIFDWTQESRDEFKVAAAAAIIVLLAMVLLLNGLAIYIRNKYQRRW
jgi:phosphate transport system permease protein